MDTSTAFEILERLSERLDIYESEIRSMSDRTFKEIFGFYQNREASESQLEILNDARSIYYGGANYP